jgi:hypothetical protein
LGFFSISTKQSIHTQRKDLKKEAKVTEKIE